MTRLKRVGVLVLTALAVVMALQNTESVETQLLFVTVSMPRAFLILLAVLIGFALGVLVSLGLSRKKKT